jgi:hypothetical protein
MTTMTRTKNSLLRNALRANAAFSGISGIIAIIDAEIIADFMGTGTALIYMILGLNLVIYAGITLYYAGQEAIDKRFAWFAVIADGIWVIASAAILLTNAFDLSVGGKWLVLILADVVLAFAIAQYIGLRRTRQR